METREKFIKELKAYASSKSTSHNLRVVGIEEYEDILADYQAAMENPKTKTHRQYRLLKRYSVIETDVGVKRLALIGSGGSGDDSSTATPPRYVVPIEQMYDIILDVHLATGHGCRDRLEKELCQKYAFITRKAIQIFLNLCEKCHPKRKIPKNSSAGVAVKPPAAAVVVSKKELSNNTSKTNSQCRVDLVDMRSQPDNDYKFILVYQDHLTKFIQIRALKTNTAAEVARKLGKIFAIFGAPHVLQSDNGCEFDNQLIKRLASEWSECRLVRGAKSSRQRGQWGVVEDRASEDVRNILIDWMRMNKTTAWSNVLAEVQFRKNRSMQQPGGIGRSPYEAMFGRKAPRMGLSSSSPQFPPEIIEEEEGEVETDEQLLFGPCMEAITVENDY